MWKRLRIALPFVFVIALAFGYRAIVMVERAAAPNEISKWNPLSEGSDQYTYIQQLHDLQSGEFPPQTFFYQPGIVYFLGAVSALISSTELLRLRLFLVALASLNCGLMALIAARLTGRRRAGWLAGLLLALYPVSAFYDTDFVITSQALILATLMLGCAWYAHNRAGNLFPPFLSGVLLGLGAVTRFELTAPAAICILWLLIRSRGNRGKKACLAGIGALLIIAPVALHNRYGDANYLITPVGPRLVYHGNNRDASGLMWPSNAEASTRLDYFHYLLHDIALEPTRFIQLQMHKLAFFLSRFEGGNNLDFHKSGQGISAALAINPLSFPLLLLMFFAGLKTLWQDNKKEPAGLLLAAGGCYCLFALLTVVESRIKTPIVAWMMPAAGYALDKLISYLRMRRNHIPALWPPVYLAGAVALLLVINWGATELPKDIFVRQLPPDATEARLIYDDTLEFVGWRVREQYSPRHTIEPYHPWVVSLYWRLLEPTEIDYSFSLKYFIDDIAFLEYDRPLGYTAYPRDYTSDWQVGPIYVEHIGMTWCGYSGPFERTGRVTLDVYPEREPHQRLLPHTALGQQASHPVLAQPAILQAPGRNEAPTDYEISFGDAIFLLGHELDTSGAAGDPLRVATAWRAGARQIAASYVIGVYLFRADDFIVNSDKSPKDGNLLTFSILPNYRFDDMKTLTLPNASGNYDLYVGVYDSQTMARLPIADSENNLHWIAGVEVLEPLKSTDSPLRPAP